MQPTPKRKGEGERDQKKKGTPRTIVVTRQLKKTPRRQEPRSAKEKKLNSKTTRRIIKKKERAKSMANWGSPKENHSNFDTKKVGPKPKGNGGRGIRQGVPKIVPSRQRFHSRAQKKAGKEKSRTSKNKRTKKGELVGGKKVSERERNLFWDGVLDSSWTDKGHPSKKTGPQKGRVDSERAKRNNDMREGGGALWENNTAEGEGGEHESPLRVDTVSSSGGKKKKNGNGKGNSHERNSETGKGKGLSPQGDEKK